MGSRRSFLLVIMLVTLLQFRRLSGTLTGAAWRHSKHLSNVSLKVFKSSYRHSVGRLTYMSNSFMQAFEDLTRGFPRPFEIPFRWLFCGLSETLPKDFWGHLKYLSEGFFAGFRKPYWRLSGAD